jgi:hypothetical protein
MKMIPRKIECHQFTFLLFGVLRLNFGGKKMERENLDKLRAINCVLGIKWYSMNIKKKNIKINLISMDIFH